MKKTILLVIMLMLSIVLFGCDDFVSHNGTEYSITYISDDKAINLSPASYISGEELELPVLDSIDTKEFVGWYENSKYSGDQILKINVNDYGDKVFYAKWNTVEKEETLEDILKDIRSYQASYVFTGNTNTYYVEKEDNRYHVVNEDNLYFEVNDYIMMYYMYEGVEYKNTVSDLEETNFLIDYSKLNIKSFNKNGNTYTSLLKNVSELQFLSNYFEASGLIFVNVLVNDNGGLEKIRISTQAGVDLVTINFSFINSTKVTLPEAIPYSVKEYTLKELNQKEGIVIADIKAYVTMYEANNQLLFLADNTGAIACLFMENTYELKSGDAVEIVGAFSNSFGIYSLQLSTLEFIELNYTMVSVKELSNLDSCSNYLNYPVSFKELTVTEYSINNRLIKVSDGLNEMNIQIPSNFSLDDLKVGSKVSLNNVFPINNGKQIVLYYGAASSMKLIVTPTPEPLVPEKITVHPTTISVANGTTLASAMDGITVFLYYTNGEHVILEKSTYTYVCNDYNGNVAGEYSVLVSFNEFNTTLKITVEEETTAFQQLAKGSFKTLKDICDENNVDRGMPSTGNVKALVVPIEFTNHQADSNLSKELNTVLFGKDSDTGWESLTSYYEKASYGRLHISGTITDSVNCGYTSSNANSKYLRNDSFLDTILKNALVSLDSKINYSDYDSDGDGFIDAIYFIYTAPVDYDSEDTLFWAFTNHFYEYFTIDGVKPLYYFWASSEFFEETPACGKKVEYNAETFIHETGHMLGLDDYYDYTNYSNGGSGGGTMMDSNVGDMDPYSKAILGWIEPIVYNGGEATFDLEKFKVKGQSIIIPKIWNGSVFDEYYVVSYYTPDGLNAFEAGYSGLFSIPGILIYHINAVQAASFSEPWSACKYSNSSNSRYKLIVVYEADGNNSISKGNEATNSDLFTAGRAFSGAKWYDKKAVNVTMNIVSLGDTARLTFK